MNSMYVDTQRAWGTPAEIEIIKRLRPYPPNAKIYFIGNKSFSAWLDNPNIRFYAGRTVPLLEDPTEVATTADVILFGNGGPGIRENRQATLNQLAGPGRSFVITACSPLLCITELKK